MDQYQVLGAVLTAMITLAGLAFMVVPPIIKLTNTITSLEVTMKHVLEHSEAHEKKLDDHERRLENHAVDIKELFSYHRQ